ncbi:hypothetical protein HK102_011221 [Quaeritorhiza haematococci]|nr:hypothetical protein HK102_011221 [Quaeritorhiza haematococci]
MFLLNRRPARRWLDNNYTKTLGASRLLVLVRDISRLGFVIVKATIDSMQARAAYYGFFKFTECVGLFGSMGASMIMMFLYSVAIYRSRRNLSRSTEISGWLIWSVIAMSSIGMAILLATSNFLIEFSAYVLAGIVKGVGLPAVEGYATIVFLAIYLILSTITLAINVAVGRTTRFADGTVVAVYHRLFTWLPLSFMIFVLPFNVVAIVATVSPSTETLFAFVIGMIIASGESVAAYILFTMFDKAVAQVTLASKVSRSKVVPTMGPLGSMTKPTSSYIVQHPSTSFPSGGAGQDVSLDVDMDDTKQIHEERALGVPRVSIMVDGDC